MQIEIESISKAFSRFPALDTVSLTIPSGELIALLGPSGSGKTTLLRVIAGLEQPDAGRVLFGGADTARWQVQDRQAGFVFQSYALFRNMSVLDNIGFGLRVRPRAQRPPAAAIRRRADELLELVQLPGLGGRYPSQLSGGQRQRVALARALAIDPRVLLLDEPFGALDAQVRRELRGWLRELHRQTGHTTVFVTHDQEEAMEMADRVVVMRDGRIEQIGTPDVVYDRPESGFVFGFIGESCRIDGVVRDGAVVVADLALGAAPEGLASGPVAVMFRPQDVELGSEGLVATVSGVRRAGAQQRVELTLGEGARLEIDLGRAAAPTPGSTIRFRPTAWRAFAPQ